MSAFIDDHKEVFGVEPICRVLTEHVQDRPEWLLRIQDAAVVGACRA